MSVIDGGTVRNPQFTKESIRMTPALTQTNLASFFREELGRVTVERVRKHFDVPDDRPAKLLRLEQTLNRLADMEVIVKHGDGTYQNAQQAAKSAMETLPKE